MVRLKHSGPNRSPARIVAAPTDDLCLEFANTRFWRGQAQPTESLGDFGALLRWATGCGAVDTGTARALLAGLDEAAAQRLHLQAVQCREALYRLLVGRVQGKASPTELRQLNELLAQAPPRCELVLAGAGTGWRVGAGATTLAELLAPVWWSAADLVLTAQAQRLRVCDNPQCRWLFLDRSKTGTRRWCSMGACGNRAKAQRHLQRRRAAEAMT